MGREPAVHVEGLRKRYGDTVAGDGVSLEGVRGGVFGLVGRGRRRAEGGGVRVLGLDPRTQGGELRRRIGCQLQESALPERIRVWEALDLFAALGPRSADWHRLLDDWGLQGKRDASFHSLSGGQRQRLFVALALVHPPDGGSRAAS